MDQAKYLWNSRVYSVQQQIGELAHVSKADAGVARARIQIWVVFDLIESAIYSRAESICQARGFSLVPIDRFPQVYR